MDVPLKREGMRDEVRARAMAAGMSEMERRKGQDESLEAKRVKHTTTTPSGDGDCPWTAFGMENMDKRDCPEDVLTKCIDRGMEHFRALAVSPASLALLTAIERELETSVLRADIERQAREAMEKKLEILQKKVIGLSYCGWGTRRRRKGPGQSAVPANGEGNDNDATGDSPESKETAGSMDTGDPEVIIARRNAEHRRMQAKLRQKRRKETRLEETRLEMERLRALEEKAEVEKEMADMVGQAEEKERRLNKSRKRLERKLEEARGEIEDLTMEHDREREQLLDSIRNQNRELQLWEQVARQILSPKEIARIWERSEYDEEEQIWVLPRIKPRSSFGGETCRLPLLTRANSVGNGCATHEEDASGQSSGGRRERRRTGARTSVGSGGGQPNASSGAGSAIRARSSGATTGTGGGTSRSNGAHGRISLSADLRPGADEGDEGNRKNKRSFCSSSDRSPRKPGSGAGLKEDGMAHDINVPVTSWDPLTRRKGGGMRMACDGEVATGDTGDIWGDAEPPEDGRYRGLTPPISPGRGLSARPTSSGLDHEDSVRSSEHHQQQEQQEHPHPQSLTRKNSRGEYAESSSRTKGPRDPEQWSLCGMIKNNQDGQSRAGDGSGMEGERCPSRQGGKRPGSRVQPGNRMGQDGQYRQRHLSSELRPAVSTLSSAPEDSLFCENDPDVFVPPASNGADATEITDAGPQRGALSRRTKNRRRRSGGSSSASPDQQQGRFMEETLKTAGLADSALGTGDLKENSEYGTSEEVRKQRERRPKSRSRRGEKREGTNAVKKTNNQPGSPSF